MDARELVMASLKPGTPLNPKNREYRSAEVLALLAHVELPQLEEMLLGDLSAEVEVKPSKKGGWMVRLRGEETKKTAKALAQAVEALSGKIEAVELALTDKMEPEEDGDEEPLEELEAEDPEPLSDSTLDLLTKMAGLAPDGPYAPYFRKAMEEIHENCGGVFFDPEGFARVRQAPNSVQTLNWLPGSARQIRIWKTGFILFG